MANTLDDLIPLIKARTKMALRGKFVAPRVVNTDYSAEAREKGDTIDVPYTVAGTVSNVTPSNTAPAPEETTIKKRQVALDKWKKVDFFINDDEAAKVMASSMYIPQMLDQKIDDLVSQINDDVLANYKGIYGYVGTAATTPFATTMAAARDLRKQLNAQRAPVSGRTAIIDVDADGNASILAAFADASQSGSTGTIMEGEIGRKLGFNWMWSHNVPTHTAGTITTGLIAKASTAQAVGLETIVGTTAASTGACALVVGDIISINGHSQTYAVTAAATQASASSDVNISISPPLQTALVGSEAITVKASHVVNLGMNRDCIAFASRPRLIESYASGIENGRTVQMTDSVTGLALSMNVYRTYHRTVWEISLLYGSGVARPELGCRLAG